MALSGVFAAVCIFCYELYYLSYYLLAPTMLAAQLAVRFASAVVFSGVIAKLACDGLARTGVLRSYAVEPGLPRYPSTMRRNKQWVN